MPVILRQFGRLFTGLLMLCISGAAFAASGLSDEGRARALALLPELVSAANADAHLHVAALRNRLAQTADPQSRAEILKELTFHAIDIAEAGLLDDVAAWDRDVARTTGDQDLLLYGDLAEASALALNGDLEAAKNLVLTTRAGAEARGDTLGVFFADAVMAIMGPELGNVLEGLSTMAQSTITLPDTKRGNHMRMLAYLTLAYTYTSVGEIDPIVDYYGKALELAEREGIAFDRESALFNMASTLDDLEERDLARQYYLALETVIEQTGRVQGRYYVLYGLAWIDYDAGDFKSAIARATEALDNFASDPTFDTSLYDLVAMSYARLGNPKEARRYFEMNQAYFDGHPEARAYASDAEGLLTQAYILHAEGDLEQSFMMLEKARKAQVQSQYERFKHSITDLRSGLETMLAKQRAEQALKEARADYNRLIALLAVFVAVMTVGLMLMQRRHTRALRRSMRDAEIANQSKSEFLANMSHELRTPLNAILGFSEMMQHQVFGKLGARQYEEYVGHINESGRHLLDIINDILDLSKIESGRLTLKEEYIDIAPVYADVQTLLTPRARERGVNIECDVAASLPRLYADRRLIKQILLNLLSNSVKFTEKGGTILMSARMADDRSMRLVISDTGIGMTRQELEVALTPFGQAGTTTTRSHEGTGLGLPLVKNLVELHGGELIIQSVKGKGTTVTASFPPRRTFGEETDAA